MLFQNMVKIEFNIDQVQIIEISKLIDNNLLNSG